MTPQKIVAAFFSPRNTTKAVTLRLAEGVGLALDETIDLLREPTPQERHLGADTLLVIGMPVYAGRIPAHCRALIKTLHADGAKAIAAVAFGNRDYDDALLELCDLLTAQGFLLAGAGAFSAQHSIFPQIAAARPDEKDFAVIDQFAAQCRTLLDADQILPGSLVVSGNADYRAVGTVPLKPRGDARCDRCGHCATLCPLQAIDPARPDETRAERCISCGACIECCPTGARGYHGIAYQVAGAGMVLKCASRREPSVFYPRGE